MEVLELDIAVLCYWGQKGSRKGHSRSQLGVRHGPSCCPGLPFVPSLLRSHPCFSLPLLPLCSLYRLSREGGGLPGHVGLEPLDRARSRQAEATGSWLSGLVIRVWKVQEGPRFPSGWPSGKDQRNGPCTCPGDPRLAQTHDCGAGSIPG